MVVLRVVHSQFFHAFEDFILRQIHPLLAPLSRSLSKLLADVAEVMALPIVHVQLVDIVEVLCRTEEASWVRRVNVPL